MRPWHLSIWCVGCLSIAFLQMYNRGETLYAIVMAFCAFISLLCGIWDLIRGNHE